MSLADRIGLLNDGEIQQVGPPREVFDRPANTWVAGFIGNPPMNLLPCALDGDSDVVRGDGFEYPVGEGMAADVREADTADDLVFGVRPMDLTIVDDSDERTLASTVKTVEPTGERTLVTATVGNEEITVETENDVSYDIRGETIHLRPERYYLYDQHQELLSVAEAPADAAYAGGD